MFELKMLWWDPLAQRCYRKQNRERMLEFIQPRILATFIKSIPGGFVAVWNSFVKGPAAIAKIRSTTACGVFPP